MIFLQRTERSEKVAGTEAFAGGSFRTGTCVPGDLGRLMPDRVIGGIGYARINADELMQVVDFPHLRRALIFLWNGSWSVALRKRKFKVGAKEGKCDSEEARRRVASRIIPRNPG